MNSTKSTVNLVFIPQKKHQFIPELVLNKDIFF